jgi:hypothetical protein
MNIYGNSCTYVSTDEKLRMKFFYLLFGERAVELLAREAGSKAVVAHGPVERLRPLLKNLFVSNLDELSCLAADYSQPIRRAVADSCGVLCYEEVSEEHRERIASAKGDWFIFDGLDEHFNAARSMLLQACLAFGYTTLGANCRGFFHTPGACVPRHCDELDVVILQLFGRRRWRMEPNSYPPVGIWDPVRVSHEGDSFWDSAFGKASKTVELSPGSVMYVPGGYWHQTRSRGFSFSLTLGLPGVAADPIGRERFLEEETRQRRRRPSTKNS